MTPEPGHLDPQHLAAIHAEAFSEPWSARALTDLLGQPGVFAVTDEDGFILIRVVADEAEILTLAVRPSARRRGLAARLLGQAALDAAQDGAMRLFLEVAEDNVPARALYAGAGFFEVGRRRKYYGGTVDALLLQIELKPTLP